MKGRIIFLIAISLLCNLFSSAQNWKEYRDIGDSFKTQKKSDSAIAYYFKARAALKKDSLNSDTYIRLSRSIAGLYYSTSQFDKACPFYEEVRERMVKINSTPNAEYAGLCNTLGVCYHYSGKLDTAKQLYLEARAIREKLFGKDTSDAYAQSCNNLGSLYRDLGQYDLAEPLLMEARSIRGKAEPVGKTQKYAITCVALASLYRDMGQYNTAEGLYLEARAIRSSFEPVKESADYASSCNILADLYSYMGKYEKADSLYLEAKAIREKKSKDRLYAETCNNLGALYRNMSQFQKAELLLFEAKDVYEKNLPEGHTSRTINLNNIGELYYSMGQYEKSKSFLLEARHYWQQGLAKDHPYLISNSDELAKVYWNLDKPGETNTLITETMESKYKQLDKVFQFTNESEKQLYLKNINGFSDEYQSFYYKKFNPAKAAVPYELSLRNRNLILSSVKQTRQTIYESGNPELIKLYTDWLSVKQQLAQLYSTGADDINKTHTGLLEVKADQLEKKLTRSSSAFRKLQQKITWKDIQQYLNKNEAAIEFTTFQLYDKGRWTDSTFYMALVLRKDIPDPVLVPLFEQKQLDSLLNQRAINPRQYVNQLYASQALFNLVWQPIEKYLSGITKIYFAPAGNLHRIAIAAIRKDQNRVLADQYQLIQLLTTASVTDRSIEQLSDSDKIVMYGDVLYNADTFSLRKAALLYRIDSGMTRSVSEDFNPADNRGFFEPLPGSGLEIDAISRIAVQKGFPVILHKGINANEESVKALNGDTSSFVLHIATHGFFYPDPGINKRYAKEWSGKVFKRSDNPLFRSGLVMAGAENTWRGTPANGIDDGILTGYEISNLYFPGAKLVVLSACETGLGDIEGSEGVYGLQRSFKMAGVQYLIMSLWDVPDDAASEFMQLFYRNVFNKLSITDAFYDAQTIMKNKFRNEPYKWAAWILVK